MRERPSVGLEASSPLVVVVNLGRQRVDEGILQALVLLRRSHLERLLLLLHQLSLQSLLLLNLHSLLDNRADVVGIDNIINGLSGKLVVHLSVEGGRLLHLSHLLLLVLVLLLAIVEG